MELNQAYCTLVGYPREERIGRSVLDLGLWADPLERDAVVGSVRSGARVRDIAARIRGRSGEVREILMSAKLIEFIDEPCVLMIGNDITERKQAEDKITRQVAELPRWHDVTLDREERMIELKREVNELLVGTGQPARYSRLGESAAGADKP